MSMKIFFFAMLLFAALSACAGEGCQDKWCHPKKKYKCCPGFECTNYIFPGKCVPSGSLVNTPGK